MTDHHGAATATGSTPDGNERPEHAWRIPGREPFRRHAVRFSWKSAFLVSLLVAAGILRNKGQAGDELVLIRIKYKVDCKSPGCQNDWNAKAFGKVLYNLSLALKEATSVRAAEDPKVLTLEDPEIFSYPFLFMTGHHGFLLNDKEVANLREHLSKGGFLLATACCGNERFTTGFEREMKKVFPDRELTPLPPQHPVFSILHKIGTVKCFSGSTEKTERPLLKGIDIDGRTVAILSPYALTCGWTKRGACTAQCKRIGVEDAFQLGTNIVLYALTH